MDCICMGKLLKCHLKGNTCRKLANGQDIDYSAKKWPQGFICPFLYNSNVFLFIQQISGEHELYSMLIG